MMNADTIIKNLQKCRQLRSNKERLEKDRNRVIQQTSALTERVARRKGEIAFSENELVRIASAIKESATGVVNNVVGFGVSAVLRDGRGMMANPTKLAITLNNAFARQDEKTRRLRQQLNAEEDKLRIKKGEQAYLEVRIDDISRQIASNNCAV